MPLTTLLYALIAFLALLFVLTLVLLIRASRSASALRASNMHLEFELENSARLLAEKETACNRRIAEKEASCNELVRRSEEACQRLLKEQFANLAVQTLKERQQDLANRNAEQMDGILRPLREQMAELQELTRKAQNENANLGQTMNRDVGEIGKIAKDLSGIAAALSSDVRFQGRKGEEILAEKLRQAGLEENVNFFLQNGIDTDRPDVQVCDSENRWLIIDSKVSLTAYLEYCDAKDENVKAAKLSDHVASVKGKIEQLARKKYPVVFQEKYKDRNYLPVTAMFVPYEAPLMEALKAEPALWQFALQNNIVLITPLTLLAYLRLVYLAWQHEKEIHNQQEIVDTARELLSRMNNYLLAFERIGESVDALGKQYESAYSIIVDSPNSHSISKSAKKLISLDVKLESRKGKALETAKCLKEMPE